MNDLVNESDEHNLITWNICYALFIPEPNREIFNNSS